MNVTLYDPTAPRRVAPAAGRRPTLASLQGRTVGFVDNAKPNFGALVADLSDLLRAKYGVARVVTHRKASASLPAAPEALAALAAECDVVIAGSGD